MSATITLQSRNKRKNRQETTRIANRVACKLLTVRKYLLEWVKGQFITRTYKTKLRFLKVKR